MYTAYIFSVDFFKKGNIIKETRFCKNGAIHSVYKHNKGTGEFGNPGSFNTE